MKKIPFSKTVERAGLTHGDKFFHVQIDRAGMSIVDRQTAIGEFIQWLILIREGS